MVNAAARSWEEQLIAEMRANDGNVTQGPLAGHPLLIMTAIGAKSGQPRRAVLTYSRDRDGFIVAGTANGSKTDPQWIANLEANPHVWVEQGNRTFEAAAEIIRDGEERDRLWDRHVEALPWFANYPAQAGRLIPMVRLTPATS